MLYYDRIVIIEGLDLGKSNCSKECMVCHYWIFNHGFKYQDFVCNGCHDLLTQHGNILLLYYFAIIFVKRAYYFCIIRGISKS